MSTNEKDYPKWESEIIDIKFKNLKKNSSITKISY